MSQLKSEGKLKNDSVDYEAAAEALAFLRPCPKAMRYSKEGDPLIAPVTDDPRLAKLLQLKQNSAKPKETPALNPEEEARLSASIKHLTEESRRL